MLQQDSLPDMMLTIAEKTLAKIFFPSGEVGGDGDTNLGVVQPGAEEIELYIEILKRQNKIKEALTALDTLYGRPKSEQSSAHPLTDEAVFPWKRQHRQDA